VTMFLSMPMQNFMQRLPDLLRGDVALAKIRALNLSMETPQDEEQLPYTERPAASYARLELSNVSYAYQTEMTPSIPQGPGAPRAPPRPAPPPRGPRRSMALMLAATTATARPASRCHLHICRVADLDSGSAR